MMKMMRCSSKLMPYFDYHCPHCDQYETRLVDLKDRDWQSCEDCGRALKRQPNAPNFIIKGFSAKNRYSKESA